MEYLLHILIFVLLYVMLSQSLVLVAGYTGMISLTHAGFFGIGAYTTALLSVNFNWPFLANLPVAILISGLVALFVSTIALRTVDDYFIIITLGIQVVIFSLMNNLMELTNGPLGVPGIPAIKILGFEFGSKISILFLVTGFATLIFFLLRFIVRSPFGLVLQGLSDDEIFVKSLGKSVYAAKIVSFTFGAMLAAIPGVLYAHYITYIDPSSFTVDESIFILSIVIIGGMRSLWGAAIAAAFLVIFPEILRFVGMPNTIAANMRQIIYGVILVIVMFRNGKGFLHKRSDRLVSSQLHK
jgi:branched-chain amino acid transport system permease protein